MQLHAAMQPQAAVQSQAAMQPRTQSSVKFHIYAKFESRNIAGSLLLDTATTEEDALAKVLMYETRAKSFYNNNSIICAVKVDYQF